MKFPYKKSKNRFNLILGLLWLVLFIGDVFFDQKLVWYSVFKGILAISYIFLFFYETKKRYFEITPDAIKLYQLPTKEIKIKDITDIKKVFDEYQIISPQRTIKISTQSLDKDYKDLFEEKIEEIRLLLNPVS